MLWCLSLLVLVCVHEVVCQLSQHSFAFDEEHEFVGGSEIRRISETGSTSRPISTPPYTGYHDPPPRPRPPDQNDETSKLQSAGPDFVNLPVFDPVPIPGYRPDAFGQQTEGHFEETETNQPGGQGSLDASLARQGTGLITTPDYFVPILLESMKRFQLSSNSETVIPTNPTAELSLDEPQSSSSRTDTAASIMGELHSFKSTGLAQDSSSPTSFSILPPFLAVTNSNSTPVAPAILQQQTAMTEKTAVPAAKISASADAHPGIFDIFSPPHFPPELSTTPESRFIATAFTTAAEQTNTSILPPKFHDSPLALQAQPQKNSSSFPSSLSSSPTTTTTLRSLRFPEAALQYSPSTQLNPYVAPPLESATFPTSPSPSTSRASPTNNQGTPAQHLTTAQLNPYVAPSIETTRLSSTATVGLVSTTAPRVSFLRSDSTTTTSFSSRTPSFDVFVTGYLTPPPLETTPRSYPTTVPPVHVGGTTSSGNKAQTTPKPAVNQQLLLSSTTSSKPTRTTPVRALQNQTTTPLGTTEKQTLFTQKRKSTTKLYNGTTPFIPPNGIKGKPRLLCMADGITFTAETWSAFFGKVFSKGHVGDAECSRIFSEPTALVNLTFNYVKCGKPLGTDSKTNLTMYGIEMVMVYQIPGQREYIESYLAQCMSQKIAYEATEPPTKIEEALEEMNITPIAVERRAEMPQCLMRIVPESDEREGHSYGPSEKQPVKNVNIGDKLKIEWSLSPASAAFGFIVTNCTVQDQTTGRQHQVIDDKGCSTDLNLLAHPHYDTYTDLAIVHWHAFKVPDSTILSFLCNCHICNDITDSEGRNSCDEIPTPPFCPKFELIERHQNSILFDFSREFSARNLVQNLPVQAEVQVVEKPLKSVWLGGNRSISDSDENFNSQEFSERHRNSDAKHKVMPIGTTCMSKVVFSTILAFIILFLFGNVALLSACCVLSRRRERRLRAKCGLRELPCGGYMTKVRSVESSSFASPNSCYYATPAGASFYDPAIYNCTPDRNGENRLLQVQEMNEVPSGNCADKGRCQKETNISFCHGNSIAFSRSGAQNGSRQILQSAGHPGPLVGAASRSHGNVLRRNSTGQSQPVTHSNVNNFATLDHDRGRKSNQSVAATQDRAAEYQNGCRQLGRHRNLNQSSHLTDDARYA